MPRVQGVRVAKRQGRDTGIREGDGSGRGRGDQNLKRENGGRISKGQNIRALGRQGRPGVRGTSEAKGPSRGHQKGPCGRRCGDARPGPLPPGRTSASPTLSTSFSEEGETRGVVTRAVAQPPPPPLPPLPPAEATHATPLPRPGPPESPSASRGPARQ